MNSGTGWCVTLASLVGLLASPPVPIVAGQAAPQFEVASVKPNTSGDSKASIQTPPGGRLIATNVTLRQLILAAYQLHESQIAGGPSWLGTDHFDIVARAESNDRGLVPSMLRALLADRFSLGVHLEMKELPIYALVLERSDRAPGAQMKRATDDCEPPTPGNRPVCGLRIMPGTVTAAGATLAELAGGLSGLVDRLVVDRTGLAGAFSVTLRWTPEQVPAGLDAKSRALGLPPVDTAGPSIFTSVREQLGLRLEARKSGVDVLVIDRAEHPKED